MKTFTKIISVALVSVMLLMVLVSCSNKLSGTYESNSGAISLIFDGEEVTYKAGSTISIELKGTYEIKDDKITLKIDGSPINGEFDFKKDGKTITIGSIEYTKK